MSGFEITFVSNLKKEHLSAEISYKGQRLCSIDKEKGSEKMEIEFLTDLYLLPDAVAMKFSLSEFDAAIRDAKNELRLCH